MVVAPEVRKGWEAKTSFIGLPSGVLVVAEPVDPLVAGRAAVVAGHFLEVVVDRQFGQADLLDLGGRHQVDAGKAAEEGHRLAVPVVRTAVEGVLLLDRPLDAVGLAGQLLLAPP